jgi:hypothetical protein
MNVRNQIKSMYNNKSGTYFIIFSLDKLAVMYIDQGSFVHKTGL